MTEYEQKQLRKSKYIPLTCDGSLTLQQAAQKIGISIRSTWALKKKYLAIGDKAFIRASKGHPGYNRKYSDDFIKKIIQLYKQHWKGSPFKAFWRGLRDYEGINIPYDSLRYILKKNKIKSGNEYNPRKPVKHESRMERKHAGELLQMDASKHDWFMNGTYTNLHGAIDDATHTVTGLYFCDNECRLGYNEVLRQTFTSYGVPEAVYIDRHSSFVTTPKHRTLEEKLAFEKSSQTHFVDLCQKLDIEIILALSAEGKGRIERLWGTLQKNLPFIFRRLGISDNQRANHFLSEWLPRFNAEFSIRATSRVQRWRAFPYKKFSLDLALSIKIPRKTDSWGIFLFHDHYFELCSPRKSCVRFTLCLSEQYGLKGYLNGIFYDIKIVDTLSSVVSGRMPNVEQDLISRYLLNDLHSNVV